MAELTPLNALAAEIYAWCERKGWNENLHLGNATCNIHSEISEGWELIRNNYQPNLVWKDADGKPQGFPIELIDAMIRILHLLAYLDFDIDLLMKMKMAYNETREHRHGGKFC